MALPRPRGDITFSPATVREHPVFPAVSTTPSPLPDPKTLHKRKIFQHRKTPPLHFSVGGRLSSWPAYASAQAILQNRKPCSTTDKTGARDKPALTVAKPRYLEQLEDYLRKELLLLDMTKDNAEELKLQPYREIFEFFIEDFKTYKPLLSSIKNAYEVALAHFREKIRSLEPLKAMLVTVSEDCNEKILAIRAEERYEIKMLKKEKLNLLKLIDKKNEEKISLQTQVTNLRKNLAEEYLHFLNERDARKILIADLNELRYQREDMSLAQSPGVISGGQERWRFLSQGKSSDQLVDVLLEEIGAGLLRERETFQGLGITEDIPEFLRTEGFIRNKKLSKKEVVDIIKDIWKERMAEEQKEKTTTLGQFFLSYLQKRFGEASAMDWSYTIFENIRLFHSNEVMKLFHDILTGLAKENVFLDQKELESYLLKELTTADSQNEGSLTLDQFSTVLKTAFPLKTEEQIQELLDVAKDPLEELDIIYYRILFAEDEMGVSGPFVHKLWSQAQNEKQAYLQELETELGANKLAEITPGQLRQALISIDPSLDEQTLDYYVSQAFNTPIAELDANTLEEEEVLLAHLQTGTFKRMGPRELEPSS
ncbi:translin-associated factor X-interacting protein 1 isoform X2 [Antechinus flavipes]|uniref:translin-associated factor X-interacting protein 1 isoform X2 n=1 Tax=Antechinus flavipes TaxID=38775 RepID=UPI002235C9C6|nr:translin-associated factor X-interacting protein 1 isoform X2 [Antechinus flavipes]